MRKLAISSLMVLTLTAMPALADFYVAGDFNVTWDPANPAYKMTEVNPGIYELMLTGELAGRHEFKITDGTWNMTIPAGSNSWLFTDGNGDVKLTYDSNTYADGWLPEKDRLGLNTDPGTWTAAGDFQGWNNANPDTSMAPMGGGIYMLDTATLNGGQGLPNGTYNWKGVVTGSWDSISLDGRNVNTANWEFTLDANTPHAKLYVNALHGTGKVELVPEPASLALLALGLLLRRR